MNKRKLLEKALREPNNLAFSEMVILVEAFGFHLSRINGSHHIFVHPKIQGIINLQEVNGKAKAYQVRQFLQLVERNSLTLGGDE
jgi:predicted RNA binding protein YcfA (HicA-like mRNA interferase family)